MSQRMPLIFFGHGNPMNALSRNSYTEGWSKIGMQVSRPKAILSIIRSLVSSGNSGHCHESAEDHS